MNIITIENSCQHQDVIQKQFVRKIISESQTLQWLHHDTHCRTLHYVHSMHGKDSLRYLKEKNIRRECVAKLRKKKQRKFLLVFVNQWNVPVFLLSIPIKHAFIYLFFFFTSGVVFLVHGKFNGRAQQENFFNSVNMYRKQYVWTP